MSAKRGREARLKSEYAALYPGIEPEAWMPVETLLRHITDLVHYDRSKSGVITGTRLLQQEHFEYRGTSERPEGLPAGATRISDSGAEPRDEGTTRSRSSETEAAKRKGQHE